MNKKLVSTLALSLCFVMGAGTLAGCKDKDGDSGRALTQDEILQTVLKAIDDTETYKGILTYKETETSVEKYTIGSEVEEETSTSIMEIGVNPDARAMLVSSSFERMHDGATVRETGKGKIFKQGDKFYMYSQEEDIRDGETEVEESYVEISEFLFFMYAKQFSVTNAISGSAYLGTGASVEALNGAWASVITDSKAKVAASSTDEDSDWYGMSAEGSYLLSASEANGACTVNVKIVATISEALWTETYVQEYSFTAKDGKLIASSQKTTDVTTSYELDGDRVPAGTAGAVLCTEEEIEEDSYIISYTFNEAAFNAITTTLPAEMPYQDYAGMSWEKKVIINGFERDLRTYGEDMEGVLRNLSVNGMDIVWYKDAACTQEITATNTTAVELYLMENVYGKATLQSGYAFREYELEYKFKSNVPEAYKVALGILLGEGYKTLATESVDNGLYIQTGGDDAYYYVDGQLREQGTTLPVVEGQTYVMKVIFEIDVEELNFFDL